MKLTIRDFFWLTLVVAIGLGWRTSYLRLNSEISKFELRVVGVEERVRVAQSQGYQSAMERVVELVDAWTLQGANSHSIAARLQELSNRHRDEMNQPGCPLGVQQD